MNKEPKTTENINKDYLLNIASELIELAYDILQTCQNKTESERQLNHLITSFHFRRSLEMFESFIILIKEERIIDASLLLRSLVNLAIDDSYLNDNKSLNRGIIALKYMFDGEKTFLKHLKINQRRLPLNIIIKRGSDFLNKLMSNPKLQMIENILGKQKWELPNIEDRAGECRLGPELSGIYHMLYRFLCNIEHHSFHFGIHYTDTFKIEPLKLPDFQHEYNLNPDEFLLLFCKIFCGILNSFCEVFEISEYDEALEDFINKLVDLSDLLHSPIH